HCLGDRVTQWERGSDPLTQCSFFSDYDEYGQSRLHARIAVPRGRDPRTAAPPGEPYLATSTETTHAQRDTAACYIVDRVARSTAYEIENDGSLTVLDLWASIEAGVAKSTDGVLGQAFNYYDGLPFEGLPYRELGDRGALMRTESLVL